ncbi:MAG: ribonuclease D [Chitinophagaceae bacterium]
MQRIQYINSEKQLAECALLLQVDKVLALDLEFDSHSYAYGMNLCLIQIANASECYLIDPILIPDLKPIFKVFEDASILKIMHSPGEDLRLLHSLNCFPKNLFDTEVVAKLLNYEKTSLSSLLEAKLGIEISKKQQRSNWLKRPLSAEQLEYAATDVAYLADLKTILSEEAKTKGLGALVEEEQEALSTTIHKSIEKKSFLKNGDYYLSPYDQFVLNETFQLRENLAKEKNRPAFQIMDESTVRALADGSLAPKEIADTKGVFGPFRNRNFAQELFKKMDTIYEAAEAQNLSTAKPERIRQTDESRSERLKAEEDKVAIFQPIQEWLATHFGEFTARYILSNGIVNELVRKSITISDIPRKYKRELLQKAAAELNIPLKDYL